MKKNALGIVVLVCTIPGAFFCATGAIVAGVVGAVVAIRLIDRAL